MGVRDVFTLDWSQSERLNFFPRFKYSERLVSERPDLSTDSSQAWGQVFEWFRVFNAGRFGEICNPQPSLRIFLSSHRPSEKKREEIEDSVRPLALLAASSNLAAVVHRIHFLAIPGHLLSKLLKNQRSLTTLRVCDFSCDVVRLVFLFMELCPPSFSLACPLFKGNECIVRLFHPNSEKQASRFSRSAIVRDVNLEFAIQMRLRTLNRLLTQWKARQWSFQWEFCQFSPRTKFSRGLSLALALVFLSCAILLNDKPFLAFYQRAEHALYRMPFSC